MIRDRLRLSLVWLRLRCAGLSVVSPSNEDKGIALCSFLCFALPLPALHGLLDESEGFFGFGKNAGAIR